MNLKDNILITGITGSGGSYLAEYIVNNHPEVNVWGLHRWHSAGTLVNIANIKDRINIIEADLVDLSSVMRALKIVRPTKIFHLAAYANVRKCFETPLAVADNNVRGTTNLLEAIRMICPESIIQICSTSEVYGNPLTFPMTEEHPLKPVNPYSASKLSQECFAYAYFKSWNLKIIITRMFAYINPRRHDLFAPAFALQIAEIERGNKRILEHGNLDSIRTIIDVRDAMETYWIAAEKCAYGDPYNIGGRDVISVGEVLEILKAKAKCKIISQEAGHLLRPVDVTRQVPDTTKFDALTGWKPRYKLEESLEWLLEHCRKEVNERS